MQRVSPVCRGIPANEHEYALQRVFSICESGMIGAKRTIFMKRKPRVLFIKPVVRNAKELSGATTRCALKVKPFLWTNPLVNCLSRIVEEIEQIRAA